MTRTIPDLELMFQVMAGADAGDVGAHPVPLGQISDAQMRRLRVGYFEQDDQVPVTEETRAAVRNCAQALSGEGFEVVPFKLKNLDAVKDVWTTFFTQSGGMLLREMYAGQEDVMSPTLREFMDRADAIIVHRAKAAKPQWQGVSLKPAALKPTFQMQPPSYVTPEIIDFDAIVQELSRVPIRSTLTA